MKVTEKVFRDSPELRNELQQVLGTSAMVHALAILEERAKVKKSPEPRPNAHLDTLTSQLFYRLQGRQDDVVLLFFLPWLL